MSYPLPAAKDTVLYQLGGYIPCLVPHPLSALYSLKTFCSKAASRSGVGASDGPRGTCPWRTRQDGAASPIFPPLDHALVKAVACELVAETKQPLSRQSLADVTARAQPALAKPLSRSTVWRILQTDAIKPWRYKYWIFPRDPQFAEKAGPILELYAGTWHGQPLGPKGSHP